MTRIKDQVASVNAVLIVADGIVQRITVDTDYVFSALSAIFPKTLANNVAFMFTNVRSPPSWRFSQEEDLGVLKGAPQFLLDNPFVFQNRFRDDPNMRRAVKACEQRSLEMLVKFFDWLDGLEPQPTTEIICLFEKYQNIEAKTINTLAQMDHAMLMKTEIDQLMITLNKNSEVSLSSCLHLALKFHVRWT